MDFIPWASPHFWGNEKKYVNEALDSLWLSGGDYITKFEKVLSDLFNNKKVLLTSNGTTSIHLAFLALEIKPGDEIIVPGFAFMAVANIAVQFGAVPVFADVDLETFCLSANGIEKKITKKTKLIVPIHTYGNVCDMDAIMEIAKKHDIAVIEDCAESLFSKYNDKYCGCFGKISTFSFHATKTITTGEGGMVITGDDKLFDKMVLYRSHGLLKRGTYNHLIPGHNFRLTNIQAAIGLAQFEKKNRVIKERKRIHLSYVNYFKEIDGINIQRFDSNTDPVLWTFALKINPKRFPQGRDGLIMQLKNKGIETRPGFISSSRLNYFNKHSLPVSEELGNNVICLPTFPALTEDQIDYICKSFLSFIK